MRGSCMIPLQHTAVLHLNLSGFQAQLLDPCQCTQIRSSVFDQNKRSLSTYGTLWSNQQGIHWSQGSSCESHVIPHNTRHMVHRGYEYSCRLQVTMTHIQRSEVQAADERVVFRVVILIFLLGDHNYCPSLLSTTKY